MLSPARFAMCDVTNHWSHPQVEGQFMGILKIITITSRRCSLLDFYADLKKGAEFFKTLFLRHVSMGPRLTNCLNT